MEEEDYRRMSLLLNILSHGNLPVKTLLRFRCLCKWICRLIGPQDFAYLYHRRSALNSITSRRLFLQFYLHHPVAAPSEFCPFAHANGSGGIVPGHCFTVVGSCYGVLCLASTPYDVCLWNPSTRTHRHLSLPNYEHFDGQEGPANRLVTFGMGCCGRNGNKKLLRFVVSFSPEARAYRGEAAIYSFRSDKWRAINCQGLDWNFSVEGLVDGRVNAWEFGKSGVFEFETIYWVVKLYNHQNGAGEFRILSFGLVDNSFFIETIPPIMMSRNPLDPLLNVDFWPFNNTVCSSCHFGGESSQVVVWVKDKYTQNWRYLLLLGGLFRRLKPLFYSKDKNKVLLQMDSRIVWYDLETTEYWDFDFDLHGAFLYGVEAYFENPLLINGAGRCLCS